MYICFYKLSRPPSGVQAFWRECLSTGQAEIRQDELKSVRMVNKSNLQTFEGNCLVAEPRSPVAKDEADKPLPPPASNIDGLSEPSEINVTDKHANSFKVIVQDIVPCIKDVDNQRLSDLAIVKKVDEPIVVR
jgi:hypothetical protein